MRSYLIPGEPGSQELNLSAVCMEEPAGGRGPQPNVGFSDASNYTIPRCLPTVVLLALGDSYLKEKLKDYWIFHHIPKYRVA